MAPQKRKNAAARPARTKTAAPKSVDDYLAAAPEQTRAVLMKLRKTIRAAAPNATEGISYGIVGFKHKGKYLVYYGYWKEHCSLYGTSGTFIEAHAAELKDYAQDKGTIRFTAKKPLPARLVTQIVKTRIAEIDQAG